MGMGMKSLKWKGIGTKNLFPHTSSLEVKGVSPWLAAENYNITIGICVSG